MPSLPTVLAANASYAPKERPVLVVFGGTNGIGAGIVKAFARHTRGRVHIVILGRSQSAANEIIASLPQHAESLYEFEQLDALLIANVRKTCTALAARLPKINFLVVSQGAAHFRVPDTPEGIHPLFALGLYGRVRAALDLGPLVEKAGAAGEDAHIMTVVYAGIGGPVDLDDIALKKAVQAPVWKVPEMRARFSTYTDIYTLELAERFPHVAVTHVYPGFIASGLKREMPFILRWVFTIMESLFARSSDDCGEFMMYALLDPNAKTGAHFKGDTAEPVPVSPYAVGTAREVVWRHLQETVDL
ncbi:NAD(P)-binding protein [Auricularia subglabra TFB-10046 SS5]|nr:NAD(P)-binding protein [Auricularia subglabra TFB-10046 SS5]